MTGPTGKTPIASQPTAQRRLGSRIALLVGFGALLMLMAFIGADSLRTLGAFEASNNRIRQDFLYREHTLDQVRAGLYESANLMTEYLLMEPSPQSREALRVQLSSIQAEASSALKACIGSLPAGTREPFQHLATEMEAYWSTLGHVIAFDPETNARKPGSFLSGAVRQQHAKALTITKELSVLNSEDLRDAERRIAEASGQFRRRLLMIVIIGLLFGLILAGGTIGYAGRLEKHLEEKYDESLQVQQELRELSKRLVDTEERERRAISRELHDEVGQSLSALLLDVQNLTEISSGEGTLQKGLQNIKASAENCLDEVRNMALLLRPSMLDDLGLVAALEWQAREVSKRTGMVVDMVEKDVSEHLPEEHKTCVYRIVQEALNNCSKHAYAKNVRVVVRQERNHLQVTIEDDGRGFDPRRMRGLGLIGMNERVTQLGGVLTVSSNPAQGTRLEVDLPLPNA